MYDEMEEFRRDAARDAIYKDYEVKVLVEFTYKTSAKDDEEAESEAYDAIKGALRGSYLDYDFAKFDPKEIGE